MDLPQESYNASPLCVLCGPRFLMAWNIYVLCNLPCSVTGGITTHWSSHACNSHARNMLRQIFINALPLEYNETILLLASMDKNSITLILY